MSDQDQVVERLDKMLALLRLAFADRIQAAREEVVSNPVNRIILERTAEGWVGAGELTRDAMKTSGQSNSAVRGRIASLVDSQILAKRGAGPKTEYRSTGLI
jgi:hypothetical protein